MPDYLWTDLLGKPAQRGCESWLNLDEPAPVPFAVDNLNDTSLQIDILSRQCGELSTPQPCPVQHQPHGVGAAGLQPFDIRAHG